MCLCCYYFLKVTLSFIINNMLSLFKKASRICPLKNIIKIKKSHFTEYWLSNLKSDRRCFNVRLQKKSTNRKKKSHTIFFIQQKLSKWKLYITKSCIKLKVLIFPAKRPFIKDDVPAKAETLFKTENFPGPLQLLS